MLHSEILALTDWAASIPPLMGVVIGSLLTYLIQSSQYNKNRIDRHNERLRIAYGTWAGALRIHTDAESFALSFAKEFQEQMAGVTVKNADKDILIQFGIDMRDRTIAARSAATNEEAAFGIIMVTDTNKQWVDRAQNIRNVTHTKIKSTQAFSPSERLKAIEVAEPIQSTALSKFLVEIAKELSPSSK